MFNKRLVSAGLVLFLVVNGIGMPVSSTYAYAAEQDIENSSEISEENAVIEESDAISEDEKVIEESGDTETVQPEEEIIEEQDDSEDELNNTPSEPVTINEENTEEAAADPSVNEEENTEHDEAEVEETTSMPSDDPSVESKNAELNEQQTEEESMDSEGNTGDDNEDDQQNVFVLNADISYNPGTYENNDWIERSDFVQKSVNGYDDNGFYKNNTYAEYFEGAPSLAIAQTTGSGLEEIGTNGGEYIDLSKSYYLIVKYSLKQNVIPDQESVVKVNGESIDWSCNDGYLQFNIPIMEGREIPFDLSSNSNFTVISGCEIEVAYEYSYKIGDMIESVTSSNEKVVVVSDYGWGVIDLRGMKPGKALLTVKGKNGSIGQYTITVTSFMEAKSVTLNARSSKYVSLKNEVWDSEYYDIYDYKTSISNKNVIYITKDDSSIKITAKYPGTSVITLTGPIGETSTIKVTVKPALKSTTKTPSVVYGSKKIASTTTPGAKVTAKIGKKTYKATAAANGKYSINIPIVKVGTKIYMKFTSAGTSLSKTITVKKGSHKVETTYWVYQNSTKVKGKATNVHIGDYIKVTVNGKVYKKKITKDAKTLNFTINISKPGKYGVRLTTELFNKYNQKLAIEKEYVYKGDTVYVGDSKNTVRWLTYWNDPVKKNTSSQSEWWYYDWDGDGLYDASLYFRYGRVNNWWIY